MFSGEEPRIDARDRGHPVRVAPEAARRSAVRAAIVVSVLLAAPVDARTTVTPVRSSDTTAVSRASGEPWIPDPAVPDSVGTSGTGGTGDIPIMGARRPAVSVAASVLAADAAALRECDRAYENGDLEASRRAALAALDQEPDSYGAEWRLARAEMDRGHLAADGEDQRRLFETAERHARRAVALRPEDTWGHTYVAIAVGRLALYHGGKTKIELGKAVRDEAERALELDPRNDLALHVLGRWNREVATLGRWLRLAAKVIYGGVPAGASKAKALEYFERAVAARPDRIHHRLELGITYSLMGRHEDAARSFETALSLPARYPLDPLYQDQARELLEAAQKKR